MTRKDKFMKAIKSKGYESIVQLMTRVETLICGNKEEGALKASTNKNYSKFISGEKEFPAKYIIALEKVLNMKFTDIIDYDEDRTIPLQFDSIRTIAYANDYFKTQEFDLKYSDLNVLDNEDEFDKFFFDYVYEYKSINSLRYLVDSKELNLENNNLLRSHTGKPILSKFDQVELPYRVIEIICLHDDVELFNKLFNSYKLRFNNTQPEESIFNNERFAKWILKTNKILNSLFDTFEINLNEYNSLRTAALDKNGIFINILANTVLNAAMKEPSRYQRQVEALLNKGIYANKVVSEYLSKNEEPFTINDKGYVMSDNVAYGTVLNYTGKVLPETTMSIRRLLLTLNKPLNELEDKNIKNRNRYYHEVNGDKEYLTSTDNEIEYEMLKYMNEKKFSPIPILYSHDKELHIDVMSYVKPKELPYFGTATKNQIIEIAKFLKEFHELSNKKLGNDKVYIHNNLSLENCSFNDEDLLVGVIDWSNCSIGNKLEDVLYILVNWTGMTNTNRIKEDVLEKIRLFLINYPLDKSINLGEELVNYLNRKLKELNSESDNYEEEYEKNRFALIFAELNKNKLNAN